MSADNGIYVLYTDSDRGPEYRVIHGQSISNIYGEWNEETARYDGDTVAIKDYFGSAPVFYTIGYTEDGICVINEFKEHGNVFY